MSVNQSRAPYYQAGVGVSTQYGRLLPPSQGEVFYVSSSAFSNPELEKVRRPTLAAALRLCVADRGDVVYVMAGHSENVVDATMLDNLVDGTSIIGSGRGTMQPEFTWTAVGSQWVLNNNNVVIENLHLDFTGIDAVVKGIDWTGTDCLLTGCDVEVATASAAATIVCEIGAAADRTEIAHCRWRGDVGDTVISNILVDGACEDLHIHNNRMDMAVTIASGCIHITAAALRMHIHNNTILNNVAASTACIAITAVAANGSICDNRFGTLADNTASAQGLLMGAGCLVKPNQNFNTDEVLLSGILNPAAAT